MHAPQRPRPQPNRVPIRPRWFRRTYSSAVSCSVCTSRRCPFTWTAVGEAVRLSFVITHRLSRTRLAYCGAASAGGWPACGRSDSSLEPALVKLLERFPVPGARRRVVGVVVRHREPVVGQVELDGVLDAGVSERAVE